MCRKAVSQSINQLFIIGGHNIGYWKTYLWVKLYSLNKIIILALPVFPWSWISIPFLSKVYFFLVFVLLLLLLLWLQLLLLNVLMTLLKSTCDGRIVVAWESWELDSICAFEFDSRSIRFEVPMRLLRPDWLQHHSRMKTIERVHPFSNARIESNRNCDSRFIRILLRCFCIFRVKH